MTFLQAHLFGKFHLQYGEQVLSGFSCKAQELFCYLLFYQNRPHLREKLAELLWDSCNSTQSKSYLRKALWQLQSVLTTHNGNGDILLVEGEWVQMNPMIEVWTDVAKLKDAFHLVQGIPGEVLISNQVEQIQDAIRLCRGELLENCYADWCLQEREWSRYAYLTMLDKLMVYYEAQKDYETSISYGINILRYDCARERTHRKLMRLYYLMGDRTAALRQYKHCREILSEELGVKPTQRTEVLYQQIQTDHVQDTKQLSPLVHTSGVLLHLKELESLLNHVQQELKDAIQDVETTSNHLLM